MEHVDDARDLQGEENALPCRRIGQVVAGGVEREPARGRESGEKVGGLRELGGGEMLARGEGAPRAKGGAREGEHHIGGELAPGLHIARALDRAQAPIDPRVSEQAGRGGAEDDGQSARHLRGAFRHHGDEEQREPLREKIERRPQQQRRGESRARHPQHAAIVLRKVDAQDVGDLARGRRHGDQAGER